MVDDLVRLARQAMGAAYAPYSGYSVGASVRGKGGGVWTGCNIENVSYGATMCAERVALFKMVSEGERELSEVFVATRDGGAPCGLCLQALLEFAPNPSGVQVTLIDAYGGTRTHTLAELIPFGFNSREVKRTESI